MAGEQARAWLARARPRDLGLAAGLCAALGAGALSLRALRRRRELRRPYTVLDVVRDDMVEDPQAELTRVIEFVQDNIIRPIDGRIPGSPFEYELLAFPFTPMVLVIGNHSAGKSTFINKMFGTNVQETGVAPTDDGFTVLQRDDKMSQTEDGPTLLACEENRPFRDLKCFSQAFTGRLQRKRVKLGKDSKMPLGLQIVDSPGMIDLPTQTLGISEESTHGGRGYNFIEAVKWFGKRADLILLLFDPDKPGTTGESLEVLTKALFGLDHKFLIVLNKVDRLDSSLDFARAYGTLGWALSKVIPRKDIPLIYTIYNEGHGHEHSNPSLPLETFREKRDEVIAEVIRAKARHWDNVITSTEDTLRQLQVVATVLSDVRDRVWRRRRQLLLCGSAACLTPAAALRLLWKRFGPLDSHPVALVGAASSYLAVCIGAITLLRIYGRQDEALQRAKLDDYFENAYRSHFMHQDSEDLRLRWRTVRPRIVNILAGVSSVASLPRLSRTRIAWIDEVVNKDIWYLRQLAKYLRTPESQS